jgi:uncharacterized protein YeaO (DUF488 family)
MFQCKLGKGVSWWMPIFPKLVYEKPAAEDGTRILVERLWPRGLKKEVAKIDEWFKNVAPSTELGMK